MPTMKQRTVGGSTYELKRYSTSKRGKQFEYYVTEDGQRIDDPVYTRDEGMRQFNETIRAVQRAEGDDRNENRGMGLGLGMSRDGKDDGGFRWF